ncbi:MAG: hypothetical protein IIB77_09140 [Proteobacteria bacterium]|nr:hypothetical protein [Pseudomonadota bacterium]
MAQVKEARLTLVGDELKAVEATGVSFQDFAHAALRAAVEDLTKPKKKKDDK